MPAFIELQNITKRFDDVTVVSDVSSELEKEEVLSPPRLVFSPSSSSYSSPSTKRKWRQFERTWPNEEAPKNFLPENGLTSISRKIGSLIPL